jgi:hypothetical protein
VTGRRHYSGKPNYQRQWGEVRRSVIALFVWAFRSLWPLKADADCQTLSFSASFYKIRLGKNHSKLT